MQQESSLPSGSGEGLSRFQKPVPLSSSVPTIQNVSEGTRFCFPGSSGVKMPRPNFSSGNDTPSSTASQNNSPSLVTPERKSPETVQIFNEDGSSEIVEVKECNDIMGKSTKKNIQENVDPARKYWTEMLEMQKTNMNLQKKLILAKIETELLKQYLMKKEVKIPQAV